jgi:hypothetical protein
MKPFSEPTDTSWTRAALLAIACGALIVTVSMGVRQSFGMFLQPIGRDFGIGREYFGFAIAVQNLLFGLAQPFVGAIADRYGVRRVLVVGTLVYAAGLVLASQVVVPGGIMASLGVLIGLGLSGTTFVVVLTGVARLVRPEQRSLAFGLVTAGGSFGQFAVVPMAQAFIASWGWPPPSAYAVRRTRSARRPSMTADSPTRSPRPPRIRTTGCSTRASSSAVSTLHSSRRISRPISSIRAYPPASARPRSRSSACSTSRARICSDSGADAIRGRACSPRSTARARSRSRCSCSCR